MTEMLDDIFRGIFRDVLYSVKRLRKYKDSQRVVTEAIYMTDKPSEITDHQWLTFVNDMSIGIHTLLNENYVPKDEIVQIVFRRAMENIFFVCQ